MLGGHIRRGSEHVARARELAVAVDATDQSEVDHERLAAVVDQDIGRFQIAVQDSALVGVLHRVGDCRHQLGRRPRLLEFREPLREISPLDELHAEEATAVLFADVVDRHDIGMIELGDRLGLVAKPPRGIGTRPPGVTNHLERYQAVEAFLRAR